MRVALTFNLRRSRDEREAEFDSPATVTMITALLEELGHTVVPIDVSCTLTALVARLRRAAPDLVFNMAEGRSGPFREAFFPAIFDQLGLPHTGSSAGVLSVCLDKALSKRLVEADGGYAPHGVLVTSERDLPDLASVSMPAIVKPNFEGSSKGITQASVVSDRSALADVVKSALARWPNGVLVERFVDGADVSVGFVEGIGILAPVGYAYEPTGPHRILDLESKQAPERVKLEVPATIGERDNAVVRRAAERAFSALGVTGYGRADFRVKDGIAHFLEMNPLPSLASGDDEIWASAAALGFSRVDVMRRMLASAP